MTDKDKKAGRPVKSVEGEGQVTIGMRVPNSLKRLLEDAAEKNHRTLSQEAERRLQRSFNPRMLVEDATSLWQEIGASEQETIRTMLRPAYGKSEVDVGIWLMEILTLVRRARGSRATVGIGRDDLEILRQAMREIEEGVAINE